jgi:hypothetical protein
MVLTYTAFAGNLLRPCMIHTKNAGYRVISVPLVNLDPGIYIYSMQAGRRILSKKMIVSR